jgi:hypothetical protein
MRWDSPAEVRKLIRFTIPLLIFLSRKSAVSGDGTEGDVRVAEHTRHGWDENGLRLRSD